MEVPPAEQSDSVYAFDSFEVSSLENTLYKDGEPIRAQYLPIQMLLILLERAGQMVTKEELRDRLWGAERFLEVDQNLYVIVSKLREILADTARQPRFIQTVSGKGYRFIGTVTQRRSVPPPETLSATLGFDHEPEQAGIPASIPVPSPIATDDDEGYLVAANRRRKFAQAATIVSAVSLLILCVAGITVYRNRFQRLYKPHDQIMVGGFSNETPKPDLNQTLAFAVQLKFQESPSFELIPPQQLRQKIANPNGASRDEQLHACSLLNGQLLLNGRLLSTRQSAGQGTGQGYEIQLMVSRCQDGHLLATESAQADSDASILSAVDLVTEKMRRRLGESDSTLQRFDIPLTQATTKSLAALEAFTQGEEKLRLGNPLKAVPSYQLAIDLDPQFALAYARIGTIYLNTQEQGIGKKYYQKAFELRDRTTDRERLYIAAHYYTDVTGEYQRAIDTYQLWGSLYPSDWGAANNLANLYDLLGKPRDGLKYAMQSVQLNPSSVLANTTLAQAYLESGEYPSLAAICNKPANLSNPLVTFHNICFLGAFARNNVEAMDQEMRWSHGNPQESFLLESSALAAVAHGHMRVARLLFSQARQNAKLNNLPEMLGVMDIDQSNAEAESGFVIPAREIAENAIHKEPRSPGETEDIDTLAGTALTLAIAGSSESALLRVNQAVQQAPLNSILNDLEVPTIHAVIAIKQKNPEAALRALNSATPLELCVQTKFAPVYYRGIAFMQLKQWKNAEAQFNQVLEHQGIVPNSLYVGLAQMQLGRALQLDGQRSSAQKAYDAASLLWKDADPEFQPAQQLATYEKSLQQ